MCQCFVKIMFGIVVLRWVRAAPSFCLLGRLEHLSKIDRKAWNLRPSILKRISVLFEAGIDGSSYKIQVRSSRFRRLICMSVLGEFYFVFCLSYG